MAVAEDPEQADAGASRPESLFCYLAFELAAGAGLPGVEANLRRWKLLFGVGLLVVLECMLATAVFEASNMSFYTTLWSPPGLEGPSNTFFYQHAGDMSIPVLFGGKVIAGKSRIEWVVASFCLVVVLLIVKVDDQQLLSASYPTGLGRVQQFIFFLLWSLRSLYRCAFVSSATIFLIVDAGDVMSIIMNSVAVTFLLEIDDLAYSAGLAADAQERYQQSAARTKGACQPQQIERFARSLFALHGLAAMSLYIFLTRMAAFSPHAVRLSQTTLWPTFIMVFRSFVLNVAYEGAADQSGWASYAATIAARSVLAFVGAAASGWYPWMLLGFSVDHPVDFDSLASCLDGSKVEACTR